MYVKNAVQAPHGDSDSVSLNGLRYTDLLKGWSLWLDNLGGGAILILTAISGGKWGEYTKTGHHVGTHSGSPISWTTELGFKISSAFPKAWMSPA